MSMKQSHLHRRPYQLKSLIVKAICFVTSSNTHNIAQMSSSFPTIFLDLTVSLFRGLFSTMFFFNFLILEVDLVYRTVLPQCLQCVNCTLLALAAEKLWQYIK